MEQPSRSNQWRMQDESYEFPYHYLPMVTDNGAARRSRWLTWGFEYMCYLLHVRQLVLALEPSALIDVGCGDGRLLASLTGHGIDHLLGVDDSARAISLAAAMAPKEVEFRVADIAHLGDRAEVVTAIEVLEHVPDDGVARFASGLRSLVRPGGRLIVCVPSTVVPLHAKHHRHYTKDLLVEHVLGGDPEFEVEAVEGIYEEPGWLRTYKRLTYNRFWRIEVPTIDRRVWQAIWRHRHVGTSGAWHLVARVRRTHGPA